MTIGKQQTHQQQLGRKRLSPSSSAANTSHRRKLTILNMRQNGRSHQEKRLLTLAHSAAVM